MDLKRTPHRAQLQTSNAPNMVRRSLSFALAITFALTTGSSSLAVPGVRLDSFQQQLQLVNELETSGDNKKYADALYDLGARYNNVGNLENAKKYFQQSLAVEEKLNRPKNQIDARMQIARIMLMQRKFDEALAMFNEIMTFAENNNSDVGAVETCLATTLMQVGKLSEAEQHYKKVVARGGKGHELVRAKALQSLANICQCRGQYAEGLKYLQEAVKLLADCGDDGDYGAALTALADYLDKSGDPKESMKTYDMVQEKFGIGIYPDVLSMKEYGQAENLYERQRIKEARDHFEKAVNLARENAADNDLLLKCLIGLGSAEADLEHFAEAQKAHQEALELATKTNNQARVVQASVQIAQDYLIQGSPERALQFLMKALDHTSQANTSAKANVLSTIARCYAGLGQRPVAARYYEEATNIYEELQDTTSKALVLNSLAVLHLDSGDFAGFDEVYAKAKDASAILPPRFQAKLEYNHAQSKLMRNDYAEAERIYTAALQSVQNSGDEGLQSAILRGLGLANLYSGKYEDSLRYYKQALAMSEDSGSIETQWDCSLGVGKAYKALKQYKEAEPYLRQAVALVEKERSNLTRDSFKTFNLDLRKDCFQELVDLLVRTERAYESLEIAERGKARAFLDMLANRKERRLASVDIKPGAPGQQSTAPLVASAEAGSRSVNVSGKLETVTFEETAVSPVNADPPTIEEIKALVSKSKSTCVEYLIANNRIYTWVVRPDGTINMPPPVTVPKDFDSRVADLVNAMTKSVKTPAEMAALGGIRQAELRNLYSLLVKPLEAYLPKDKNEVVTIIPHDVLFRIPFAALMADNGDYLIEQHTLSYVPAIGVFRSTQRLQEQAGLLPHKLLAFGNPITQRIAFLGALPYAEKEVKHIAEIFGQNNATVEIGGAATKDKFAELVPAASEIHLATHGLVDEEHPMKSALVLAPTDKDDGLLSVRDILTLKNLKARMVVLSACQTGRGKITGDGVVGLSRAFIIAGAPSVLVSQWNVDDVMTEFQMEKFYRFYLKGEDKARALRDAQLATIHYMENTGDNVVAHDPAVVRANPRYWAAFQLIGEI